MLNEKPFSPGIDHTRECVHQGHNRNGTSQSAGGQPQGVTSKTGLKVVSANDGAVPRCRLATVWEPGVFSARKRRSLVRSSHFSRKTLRVQGKGKRGELVKRRLGLSVELSKNMATCVRCSPNHPSCAEVPCPGRRPVAEIQHGGARLAAFSSRCPYLLANVLSKLPLVP